MTIVQLPTRAPSRLLSKRELARELGRSPRWIEMRMREGMPVQPRALPGEHARFDLARVRAWLDKRASEAPAPSLEQRVADLERQVRRLVGERGESAA